MLALVAVRVLAAAPSPEHRPLAPVPRRPVDRGIDPRSASSTSTTSSSSCRRTAPSITTSARSPGADGIPNGDVMPPRPEGATVPSARITTRTSSTAGVRITSAPRGSRSTRGRWTARSWRFERSATRVASTRRGRVAIRPSPGPNGTPDVMGYHTAHEIPNYWTYAQRLHLAGPDVRAERLVDAARAPVPGVGRGPRRATTSTRCSAARTRSSRDSTRPTTAGSGCRPTGSPGRTCWADITWLLHNHGVSWAYYVGKDSCIKPPCSKPTEESTNPIMNPLPGFKTVEVTKQFKNIRPNTEFFDAAANGTLPVGLVGRARRSA